MADVTGRIGNEEVELNNAATEATLKLLLQATLAAAKGSTEEVKKIAAMAGKAGLDSASIERANTEVRKTSPEISKLGQAATIAGTALGSIKGEIDEISQLAKKIAAGDAQASDVFSAMGKLPGPLGLVAKGFSLLATYQEGLLKSYQDLSKSGVNFAGSLTEMRLAASNSMLTMSEFSDIMKNNSQSFRLMGQTANDGAKNFLALSSQLVKGDLGDDLRALGMTTKDMNQGLLDYIATSGGRSKEELRNTKAIAAASAAYMAELDALTQYTGVSKDKLREEQQKAAQDAAFQRKLASLGEEERLKLKAAYDKAIASGIEGAADLVKSTALGLPPATEAARTLSGIAPQVAQGFTNMTNAAMDTSKKLSDVDKEYGKTVIAAREASQKFGQTGDAIAIAGGKQAGVIQGLIAIENQTRTQGITSLEDYNKVQNKIKENQKTQGESQAKDAAITQKSMQELTKEFNELAMKILPPFMTIINSIMQVMVEYKGVTMAVVGALLALKAASAVSSQLGSLGIGSGAGRAGGGAGALGGLGQGAGAGVGGLLKGISSGLSAFANPAVALGAVGFGAAIAAIGAGIAAASWLTGKALPTLSEGMASLQELDGDKLGDNAKGMALVGGALLTFVPFGVTGIPAAYATGMLADNLTKLAAIDPVRLEKTAAAMQKVKDATPSIGGAIASGISGLFGKLTGSSESSTPATPIEPITSGGNFENVVAEMQRLNTVNREMLLNIKETVNINRQTLSAIKAMTGDHFSF